jgi:hypothetical protein
MSLDDHIIEAAAIEDTAVSLVVLLIGSIQPSRVDVETIGVLHQKLADAQ